MKLVGYSCRHREPPLRDVYLPLEPLTVLLGRNDAGKSTLLRAVERDLAGGHYSDHDDEAMKDVGGVFFAVVTDTELRDLIVDADSLRRKAREDRLGHFGQRPPWGLRNWALEHFDKLDIDDGDPIELWLTRLRDKAADTAGFSEVLDAVGASRLVALEPAGVEDGDRVWNVSWCLPPLGSLPQPLQDGLAASDLLPFVDRRERAKAKAAGKHYGFWTRGFYILFHGYPSHLWAPGAPVVTAPIGQTRSAQLPRGLAVPADFAALRTEVTRSLNDLVIAARYAHDEARREDPLTADELEKRAVPPQLARDRRPGHPRSPRRARCSRIHQRCRQPTAAALRM